MKSPIANRGGVEGRGPSNALAFCGISQPSSVLRRMQDTADRIVSERARVAVPAVGQALCRPLATLGGEVGAIVLIVPLLLALAPWKGFPFLFYDTGGFVLEGLGHA